MSKSASSITAAELSKWINDATHNIAGAPGIAGIKLPKVPEATLGPGFPVHATIVGLIIKDEVGQIGAGHVAEAILGGVREKLAAAQISDLKLSPLVLPSPHGTIVGFIQAPFKTLG